MTKYCLTGTTGGLGSRVLHHLLHTLNIPAEDLIISLHNPSKAPEDAKALGIDIRQGDYTSSDSLRKSFKGADRLLLVSYPSIAHRLRVDAHISAIDAARDVGVKHIYYTSLAFSDDSEAAVQQAHLDTTKYLGQVCDSGSMTYTVIKEGIYSESFPLYLNFHDLDAPQSQRKAYVPLNPTQGISWVTRDELGEATAKIMVADTSTQEFRNKGVLLSGPEPWTLDRLASAISNILGWKAEGYPLEVEGIGKEAWIDRQAQIQSGSKGDPQSRSKDNPEAREFANLWETTYPAIEKGELAVVDPLCARLLGRRCTSMEQFLQGFLKGKEAEESVDRYAK